MYISLFTKDDFFNVQDVVNHVIFSKGGRFSEKELQQELEEILQSAEAGLRGGRGRIKEVSDEAMKGIRRAKARLMKNFMGQNRERLGSKVAEFLEYAVSVYSMHRSIEYVGKGYYVVSR